MPACCFHLQYYWWYQLLHTELPQSLSWRTNPTMNLMPALTWLISKQAWHLKLVNGLMKMSCTWSWHQSGSAMKTCIWNLSIETPSTITGNQREVRMLQCVQLRFKSSTSCMWLVCLVLFITCSNTAFMLEYCLVWSYHVHRLDAISLSEGIQGAHLQHVWCLSCCAQRKHHGNGNCQRTYHRVWCACTRLQSAAS